MKTHIMIVAAAAVMLAGCEPAAPTSKQIENRAVEVNQARLIQDIPAPTLQTSLERKNLAERLERINQQNMSGFVYLLSYGRVVASYPIRGRLPRSMPTSWAVNKLFVIRMERWTVGNPYLWNSLTSTGHMGRTPMAYSFHSRHERVCRMGWRLSVLRSAARAESGAHDGASGF
ncbi:hypothetical protein HED49_13195 [Ochrobactrum daejeonense]|nr:hypothetical protein [Brucella daejeonensis]